MTHRLISEVRYRFFLPYNQCMNINKLSSNCSEHHQRKSTEYFFQPIKQKYDLYNQIRLRSPFRAGLKYLKLLGQMKRHNETMPLDRHPRKPVSIDHLERKLSLTRNYYVPLPSLSPNLTNKSIQVDDFDESSYQTAINNNHSYLYFYEFLSSIILLLFFIIILLFLYLYSYPIHCIMHKKFWHPNDLSNGYQCENISIEIHYVEIYSIVYQLEIIKNVKSITCLGFDILSCLPIDYVLVPKGQTIHRNDQLIKYCNRTQKFHCNHHSLNILPYESKWNFKNNHFNELTHCSCLKDSNNKCFHFKLDYTCDMHIPWFDYCLKYSTTNSVCQAYVKQA